MRYAENKEETVNRCVASKQGQEINGEKKTPGRDEVTLKLNSEVTSERRTKARIRRKQQQGLEEPSNRGTGLAFMALSASCPAGPSTPFCFSVQSANTKDVTAVSEAGNKGEGAWLPALKSPA